MCSELSFEADVSGSLMTTGDGSLSRPKLWVARRLPKLRPLPHRILFCAGIATSLRASTMAAKTAARADHRRRKTSVSSSYA